MDNKTIRNIINGYKIMYQLEHDLDRQICEVRSAQDDLIRAICSEIDNEELNDYIYSCIAYHGNNEGGFDLEDFMNDLNNLINGKEYYESIVRGLNEANE